MFLHHLEQVFFARQPYQNLREVLVDFLKLVDEVVFQLLLLHKLASKRLPVHNKSFFLVYVPLIYV